MGVYRISGTVENQIDTMGTSYPLNPITGRVGAGDEAFQDSGTYAGGTIASGASATQTVTVAGTRTGDIVELGFDPALPNGVAANGYVSANGTVTATFQNISDASITVPSTTIYAVVRSQSAGSKGNQPL